MATKTNTVLWIALAIGFLYIVDWLVTWAIVAVRT